MTKYEVLLCIYYYLDREYFAEKIKAKNTYITLAI